MKENNFYQNAHLIVSAIRVFKHRNNARPSVEDICSMLSMSTEQGHLICNKLDEIGVIEMVKSLPGETRIFISDHMKIEEIPQDDTGTSINEEIEKFQNSKKEIESKIESFQAEQEKKKQDLFAEIESRLKKEGGKTPFGQE